MTCYCLEKIAKRSWSEKSDVGMRFEAKALSCVMKSEVATSFEL